MTWEELEKRIAPFTKPEERQDYFLLLDPLNYPDVVYYDEDSSLFRYRLGLVVERACHLARWLSLPPKLTALRDKIPTCQLLVSGKVQAKIYSNPIPRTYCYNGDDRDTYSKAPITSEALAFDAAFTDFLRA